MALTSKAVTLNNLTPTLLVDSDNMVQEVHLHNMTKSSNQYIYLGEADMTIADSIHIDPGETLTLRLFPTDRLFAMSDPSGLVVGVLNNRHAD